MSDDCKSATSLYKRDILRSLDVRFLKTLWDEWIPNGLPGELTGFTGGRPRLARAVFNGLEL